METDFIPQRGGVKQGCSLSPTLFNILMNWLSHLNNQIPLASPSLTQKLNAFFLQMI